MLASGWFILGQEVKSFEEELAAFLGVRHVVGVGNGMDAIEIALRAAGVGAGDEVITTPNSAFATTLAVLKIGAVPRFVDIDERTYGIEARRSPPRSRRAPRAILPVHIYGAPLDLTAIGELAEARRLQLVNDAAQAHGARWQGRDVASYGIATSYSFYPTKNLGCFGDGGAVASNDDAVAAFARRARDYGQERRYVHVERHGLNSRLDELQAAILRVRLRHLAAHNQRRAAVAAHYRQRLAGLPLRLPETLAGGESAHHLFVVRTDRRDALQAFLTERGVQTLVHYPLIIPLQPAVAHLGHQPGAFPSPSAAPPRSCRCRSIPSSPTPRSRRSANRCGRSSHEDSARRRLLRAGVGVRRSAEDDLRSRARLRAPRPPGHGLHHRRARRRIAPAAGEELRDGIRIVRFANWSNTLAWRLKIFLPRGMRRWLDANVGAFDVVHLFDTRTLLNAWAARAAASAHVPFVLSVWGSLPRGEGWRALIKARYDRKHGRILYGGAAALLAQNDHEAQLYGEFGAARDRVVVWPLGVDPAEFATLPSRGVLRKKLGIADTAPLALFVGRINELKGVEPLVRAFAAANVPESHLAIVGRDDGALASAQRLARELGLAERVHFPGPMYGPDVIAAYVDCDLFCITPTHFEETSLASLAACACRRPVLINDRCGIPWLDEYDAGVCVAADERATAEALSALLCDRARLDRMGGNARRMVEERFFLPRIVDQAERIYHEAVSGTVRSEARAT